MKFTVEIECDNAAFAFDPHAEVARLLARLAEAIETTESMAHPIFDTNGNRVGRSTVEAS